MVPYHDEEIDPGTDDPLIDPKQLIEDLKSSRHVLHVAEYASKTFDENLHNSNEHHRQEFGRLTDEHDLATKAIRAAQASTNEFLRNMFVRFGRKEKESLAFQKATLTNVKAHLQRRILLTKRGVDAKKHRRVISLTVNRKDESRRQDLVTMLADKKASGDIMFRNNIPNAYLKRIVRHTRELIQGISSTMTYDDLIQDLARKFNRVREYMHDDAVTFSANIDGLMARIEHQHGEINYLRNVLHETDHAAQHAEKEYFASAGACENAETAKKKITAELKKALDDHEELCRRCTTDLVAMNEKLNESSNGCMKSCPQEVRRYPHAMWRIEGQPESKRLVVKDKVMAPTEIARTFERLQEFTRTQDPAETVRVFREQVDLANRMTADVHRLDHLLTSVLRQEDTMFQDEFETNEAAVINRAAAAAKFIKELQDNYDHKVEEARSLVNCQRDNAQEFENFIELLLSINDRIIKTFGSDDTTSPPPPADQWRIEGRAKGEATTLSPSRGPGTLWTPKQRNISRPPSPPCQSTTAADQQLPVREIVEMTEKNLNFVAGKIPALFGSTWEKLQLLVEDSEFLEYRGRKKPPNNDRTVFDTAVEAMKREGPQAPPVFPHPHFITNSQFKAANEQILERARLTKLARLKEANKAAEKRNHPATMAEKK